MSLPDWWKNGVDVQDKDKLIKCLEMYKENLEHRIWDCRGFTGGCSSTLQHTSQTCPGPCRVDMAEVAKCFSPKTEDDWEQLKRNTDEVLAALGVNNISLSWPE